MKKFILKVAILIAPFILVFLLLESNLGKITNSYNYKKANLEKIIQKIEVINLGSSHEYMGIDPDYYDYKGFNLANVSQSIYYDYSILNKFINKGKEIKVVLIPISYFSLGFKMIDSDEYWREFFYKKFYNIPVENNSKVFDLKNYSLFALYGKDESYSYIRKRFKVNLAENVKENGSFIERKYSIDDFMKNINDISGKERVKGHNKVFDYKNVSQNKYYLGEIIKACKSKNIVPIILTTPVYKTYSENMKPDIWSISQKVIKNIQKDYGVMYFNYLNDKRFTKEDFRDNDHLNPKGAEKFSKIINEEILKLVLLQ